LSFITVILFILLGILVIGIPVTLLYFLQKWLSKKGYKKIGLIFILSISITLIYNIYTAIYPNDSFFKDEFTNGLMFSFPDSGKVLAKDAGYPDTHGKYCSCSLISVNKSDFEKTIRFLNSNPIYTNNDTNRVSTPEFDNVLVQSNNLDTTKMLSFYNKKRDIKNNIAIGFLTNKNYIIFQRCNF
jgi:hypothetical protein